MKFSGHTNDTFDLLLNEVILETSSSEARKIASFLTQAANNMDSMGDTYDHEHLSDFLSEFENSTSFCSS